MNMMLVLRIEPGLPMMPLLNIKLTLAARIRVKDFATGPSMIDRNNSYKAVFDKIPGKGTNLGSSEWN
jgi:hypothetical protein